MMFACGVVLSIGSTCLDICVGHSQNGLTRTLPKRVLSFSGTLLDQLSLAPERQSDESLSLTVWFGILLVGDDLFVVPYLWLPTSVCPLEARPYFRAGMPPRVLPV